MTHWTAPTEPKDRKPRAGDTIEDRAALNSLDLGSDGIVVLDSNRGYEAHINRVFVLYNTPKGSTTFVRFEDSIAGPPVYPLTVVRSYWREGAL